MAIGRRKRERQEDLWVATSELSSGPGHPFYERVNELLASADFDSFVEEAFALFYADDRGRPGLAPGVYVRMLLVGYFEGIDSERGIAWRCADSLALRRFLGLALSESPADHSTVSRTRRLVDLETHGKVFGFVLRILFEHGLIQGKTVGIDATTLEANAAMKSLVRREDGLGYQAYLEDLAKASGIETPTRADLARIDRKRPRKGSNDDWQNPNDPDAEITKMKDGRTHLAHKAEHAVDMDSGAVLAAMIQPGAAGDTTTILETLTCTVENVVELRKELAVAEELGENVLSDLVGDKGYHSNETLLLINKLGMRSYIAEPDRGRRRWKGKEDARQVVYANRRRIKGDRGRALMRKRGELLERPFAHCLETGGMRRVHLRRCENIAKRYLVHVAGHNLGVLMRSLLGKGSPRGLRGLRPAVFLDLAGFVSLLRRRFCQRIASWIRSSRFAPIASVA